MFEVSLSHRRNRRIASRVGDPGCFRPASHDVMRNVVYLYLGTVCAKEIGRANRPTWTSEATLFLDVAPVRDEQVPGPTSCMQGVSSRGAWQDLNAEITKTIFCLRDWRTKCLCPKGHWSTTWCIESSFAKRSSA